jgi:hypothetical protein
MKSASCHVSALLRRTRVPTLSARVTVPGLTRFSSINMTSSSKTLRASAIQGIASSGRWWVASKPAMRMRFFTLY